MLEYPSISGTVDSRAVLSQLGMWPWCVYEWRSMNRGNWGYVLSLSTVSCLNNRVTHPQCPERSGGPTGDGGDNAKMTGRVAQDGTASRSQASQWAGPGFKFLSPAHTRPKPWWAGPISPNCSRAGIKSILFKDANYFNFSSWMSVVFFFTMTWMMEKTETNMI